MTGKPDQAPAATLVIFGATGDLTRRLLVPALVNLLREGLVGDGLNILGVAREDMDDERLRSLLDEFVDPAAAGWADLRRRIAYLKGGFEDDATYRAIGERLGGADNAAFYLATPPDYFGTIAEKLAAARLLDEGAGFRRVLVEKPFGHDLASALTLNERIVNLVSERQIYRIDHFLGKETVQNILVARFANPMIEAVWNNRYVDHVQITAAETVGVGRRGRFYDATGAMRDMVPNHLFQLLAMVGMEPPNSFAADAIGTEKTKVVSAIRTLTSAQVRTDIVRGQYVAGRIGGEPRAAYSDEADVDPGTRTETYVAMKLWIDTWRWSGVPFYLRTGKAMAARETEIVLQFKPVPRALFRHASVTRLPPNRLVIHIQPDEGVNFDFLAKLPGPVIETAPVSMNFRYADHFALRRLTGYETLLYDMMIGDQTLFQSAEAVEAAWAAVQPVLDAWSRERVRPQEYRAGSDGPVEADALLERDGRAWHGLRG
ncbi:glucose-6-phosphate dehydrogenase [Novosphingobium sp. H3SJ31-1]|uniref:Glucose-6-phosphate 1-dehydrogenase n=2 Tax=Novosphingobium album (ex Liu et al. 2023) TaxID=3031130 RepID=A0ABT5WRV6_9SPHN|nr:glucose-6-phosphate dehydrogenase [Novosphingobium album (ex Liu et al. 2023)]